MCERDASRGARYGRRVSKRYPSLVRRLWLALSCGWRIIFDRDHAGAIAALPASREVPDAVNADGTGVRSDGSDPAATNAPAARRLDPAAAELLLGLLQRGGRLVDFLQQDIEGFGDADVAAAARLVHAGCSKVLAEHARIEPVCSEAEESTIEVPAGYDPVAFKLIGRLTGQPPYRGVLRHRGWRVSALDLPAVIEDHDTAVLAPAEVEL